jgi:DNA polymerase III alpha subunit
MAMFLAVIRPAKRHLIGKTWKEVAETVWDKPSDDSYFFKKSHAVAYAHLVAVNMNLLTNLANQGN